ncbi:MAG: ABC transporter substrate-binding protein [Pseudomonadota bacterium]
MMKQTMIRSAPLRRFAAALATALLAAGPAAADEITIALQGEPLSIDPHFHNGPGGHMASRHVFERLTDIDADGRLQPGLALRWAAEDETTWVFELRPDVIFHDGSSFGAEDVIASIERIPNINSGAFSPYIQSVATLGMRDPLTLVIETDGPRPTLPGDLSLVNIIPSELKDASTEAFASGEAMIGTGPFVYQSYKRSQAYSLARNERYWGEAPDWERVTFRFITDGGARLAALLAKEVDFIQNPPALSVDAIRNDDDTQLFSAPTYRVYFLNFDLANPASPFTTDAEGAPLAENPLLNADIRKAIASAINRELLVDRVMNGFGEPVQQMASEKTFGHVPGYEIAAAPLEEAKALIAQAGYPEGFGLTIHAPMDTIAGSPGLAQGIASLLARIGVRAQVATAPWAVYYPEVMKEAGPGYSAWMMSWGNNSGDSMDSLQSLLHSRAPQLNLGAQNQSRFSNPEFDDLVQQALVEVDAGAREALQQEAMRILMDETALVPLFTQVAVYGGRKGLRFAPNPRGAVHAHEIHKE